MFSLSEVSFCGLGGWTNRCVFDPTYQNSDNTQFNGCHCHVVLKIRNNQDICQIIKFVYKTGIISKEQIKCMVSDNKPFQIDRIEFDREPVNYENAEEMNADTNVNDGYILSTADISKFSAFKVMHKHITDRNWYHTLNPINTQPLHANPNWLIEDTYSPHDERNNDPILGNIADLIKLTQRAIDELYFIYSEIERPESQPLLK